MKHHATTLSDVDEIIILDAETFYSKEYSLRRMANSTYVRSPLFKEHLWGYKFLGSGRKGWLPGSLFPAFAKTIDWRKTAVVGHNLRFDGFILAERHGIDPALWVDTLGMSRMVLRNRTAKHGLDALSQLIGRKGKFRGNYLSDVKGVRDPSPAQLARLGEYCVDDIEDTEAVFNLLRPLFPEKEYWFMDWVVRMSTEPKLVFNLPDLERGYQEEVDEKAAKLAAVPYTKTQLSSNPQFAKVLTDLGVTPPTKVSKTTGRETFAFAKGDLDFAALLNHEDPLVQRAVTARMAVKSTINESRAKRFINLADEGPWSVPLNYAGAINTARLSGGDKQNPQNLSRGSALRDAIRAPKGCLVVAVDSAGIEMRVAATIAGQTDIVERALKKQDEYARFASIVFGFPVNKHENPEERNVGKVAVLSLGYQSGAGTYRGMLFAQTGLIKPMDVCEHVVKTFRSTYDKYPLLWRDMRDRLKMLANGIVPPNLPSQPPITWNETGYTSNYSGTKVEYPGIRWEEIRFGDAPAKKAMIYNDARKASSKEDATPSQKAGFATIYGGKATENLCQFLAREVVNYQTLRIYQQTGLRPQLQVHDELIYVVPENMAEPFYKLCVALMSGPVPWWPDLITSASGGFDISYGAIDK